MAALPEALRTQERVMRSLCFVSMSVLIVASPTNATTRAGMLPVARHDSASTHPELCGWESPCPKRANCCYQRTCATRPYARPLAAGCHKPGSRSAISRYLLYPDIPVTSGENADLFDRLIGQPHATAPTRGHGAKSPPGRG